jgi:hypothetical protein
MLAGTFLFTTNAPSLAETTSGVFLGHCFTTLICLPALFLYPPKFDAVSAASIAFLGIFQLGVSYVLLSYSARACPALALSLICMIEPILIRYGALLSRDSGPTALAGGVLVIATLTVWCISNLKSQQEMASKP